MPRAPIVPISLFVSDMNPVALMTHQNAASLLSSILFPSRSPRAARHPISQPPQPAGLPETLRAAGQQMTDDRAGLVPAGLGAQEALQLGRLGMFPRRGMFPGTGAF